MARQRCILPLIIVCTLLFVTVVTAFRLRDLSAKSPTERQVSARTNPLLEKCVGCDSDSEEPHQRHFSVSALKVKEISSRRSYEDVKKAVKEQQELLNKKIQQQQSHRAVSKFSIEDSDDEDDDDDDEDDEDEITLSRIQASKSKDAKEASGRKNDQNKMVHTSKKTVESATKTSTKITPKLIHPTTEDSGSDDDEDDGDDDDDSEGDDDDNEDNDNDDKEDDSDAHSESEKNGVDDDDDDDEDEDDDSDEKDSDEEIKTRKKEIETYNLKARNQEVKVVKEQPPVKTPAAKPPIDVKKVIKVHAQQMNDSDDDSDDDDDDDDDDDEGVKYRTITAKNPILVAPKQSVDSVKADKPKPTPETKQIPAKQVIEKPQTLPQSKESNSKETKPSAKSDTKVVVQDPKPEEKVKKEKDNEDFKKDHKTHQEPKKEVKQTHEKEQSLPPPHSKKSHNDHEGKSHKGDANKQNPKEEKSKKAPAHDRSVKDIKKKVDKSVQTESEGNSKENVKYSLLEKKQTKDKNVLEHASNALYRKNFLQSEFEDFYAFLPSFAPNFSRIHNAECRRHGQILMRQLRGTKLWALNMLDASGKVPSGILQGNGNQLGDFDQCLGSRARVRLDSGHVVKIHGKYCLAQIDLRADDPELQLPIHLAQARNLVKSKFDDPGHFIPRFSSLNWGVCMPASCGPEEAEFVLKDALRQYHLAGLRLRVSVDPLNCHTEEENWLEQWLEPPTLITISLFSTILLIVIYATLKDCIARRGTGEVSGEQQQTEEEANIVEDDAEKEQHVKASRKSADEGIVASFSLYNSCSRLVRDGDAEDIACIHGVRALCSLTLLLAHKIIPVANTPFLNRVRLTELSHTALAFPLRMGWVYTDAFLLLSGALTAHRLSADLDGEAGVPWLRRYIARYVRLTPALLCSVLFYAYVWEGVGAGPLWGTLVAHNARLCRESWWWNLLYVQNFFAFDEMCAPQTYQLALDMQLTLIAAALVWAVRSRPLPAAGALVALQAVTAYARYSTTAEHRLSLVIYHGASVSQLYRTASLSYTSTLHRSTPYIAGLVLGVLLQRRPASCMPWLMSVPCWSLCLACLAVSMYPALDASSSAARYSAAAAASYAALAPLAAAAALAWIIYAAHSGNAQWLNRMLRARPLVLVSRLSYAMYLCQFVVFFSNAATVKTATEFTIFSILDVQELAMILAVSAAMTLTLVIPMQSLSKYVMSYRFSTSEEGTQEGLQENTSENATVVDDQADEPEIEGSEKYVEEPEDEDYNSRRIMVHRELLEEILEAEVEYESQRDSRDEGLEEILEEEEDELGEEEMVGEEDLEMVETLEVEGGQEDFWGEQEEEYGARRRSREYDDQELDEWELNSGQNARAGTPRYR